jgi:ADP-L-glycero-D-manno-heptose 6-epimerase
MSAAPQNSLPILVTGAAGFIGSRFVQACNARGIPVVSVDELEQFSNRTEHAGIDFGKQVDLENLFDWLAAQARAFRGIVHLGACSDTTETNQIFLDCVNLGYSKNIWNYATAHATPLVYASSAATYGGGEQGYEDDEGNFDKLKALNLYGDSKLKFDFWALAQEAQGIEPPVWSGFKFFNVYGPGERHKGKMSSVVLQSFDQIRVTGGMKLFRSHREGIDDGHQSRDFIFVDDVIDVLFFALERPIRRGIYNLGTGRARPFYDLARAVFHTLEVPENIIFIDTPEALRGQYQYFTEASMEKLRGQGYNKPFTSLEEGVRQYVQALLAAEGT